jgi:hypothetical protein
LLLTHVQPSKREIVQGIRKQVSPLKCPRNGLANSLLAMVFKRRTGEVPITLFIWLISHQPAVLFSQNQPAVLFSQNKQATSNQPAVLFSQNKQATSNQPAVLFS